MFEMKNIIGLECETFLSRNLTSYTVYHFLVTSDVINSARKETTTLLVVGIGVKRR